MNIAQAMDILTTLARNMTGGLEDPAAELRRVNKAARVLRSALCLPQDPPKKFVKPKRTPWTKSPRPTAEDLEETAAEVIEENGKEDR